MKILNLFVTHTVFREPGISDSSHRDFHVKFKMLILSASEHGTPTNVYRLRYISWYQYQTQKGREGGGGVGMGGEGSVGKLTSPPVRNPTCRDFETEIN